MLSTGPGLPERALGSFAARSSRERSCLGQKSASTGLLAALCALLGGAAAAQDPLEPIEPIEPIESRRWAFDLFPSTDPYPPNVASPHRLTNSVELLAMGSSGIAGSGDSRMFLRLGGRFGVLRLRPRANPSRSLQLGIEAGFAGQFDNDASQDNIGWDGFYGLTVTAARGPRLAWKAGLLHTSAHVGDEYLERTGRGRIGYTREELLAGLNLDLSASWRAYLEAAHAHELRIDLQRPWRVQVGLVFEDRDRFAGGGRFGWYAAADLSSWEERDWRTDWALQAGLLFPAGGRVWRAGIAYVDGRPPLGEFFQDSESYLSAGLWVDL
ncbi:MAG TPA: DUF1207 domain-containing protein [Thermoanaerobaculia bacterium]|nr:DUF1207 domain-containing protein [Thermoanaerobaculia bacterium]